MAPGYFYDKLTQCGADIVTRPLLDGSEVDPGMVRRTSVVVPPSPD